MSINFFNFKDFNGRVLLTNDLGKHLFISKDDFNSLVSGTIDKNSETWKELLSSKMVYEDSALRFSETVINEMREIKSHCGIATSLHIFVVTTACNMNCMYCQANNGIDTPNCYMSPETARRAVEIALQSPSRHLGFEFQGGEPLLNYAVIKEIIEYTEKKNTSHEIEFSLVSNLSLLTDEMLDFFCEHNVSISTSVDGPEEIHNLNRPFKSGKGSFDTVSDAIDRIRSKGLGVGAIETTTKHTLSKAKELIESYINLGFDSVFIRPLTQLGKASNFWDRIGYSADEFLVFYKEALEEVFRINSKGIHFKEQHASILLQRMNGKRVNYMELRSPCGGGIGQLAYFSDGKVYTCDEGRMLSEMGDHSFLLGDVYSDSYSSIIENGTCRSLCASSILETIPSCCDCVYQPYCGTCPVVNYALHNDLIEKTPRSFRCKVYKGILDYLFEIVLKNDELKNKIINEWSL